MAALAVAGLSARVLAEAAAREGHEVMALDLYGDVDTCAVASRWFGIGEARALRIDDDRLLAALGVVARSADVLGWVAGSGFDGRPDLLARGAEVLPLIGAAPAAQAAVRDPRRFFAFLDAHDVDHPPVRWDAPDGRADDWLLKDAAGCGGRHIRIARAGIVPGPGEYLQRRMPGTSMSATFVADGRTAVVLGCNRQIVRRIGALPHVYCGVVGPLPAAGATRQRLHRIVDVLVAGFGLRGLGSVDFLLDAGHVGVLEVNPRPPASMALYAAQRPLHAHLRACLHGELPPASPPAREVEGNEVVRARRPLVVDDATANWLADWPDVHDIPCAGQRFDAGDPLCTVGARAADAGAVAALLHDGREALLASLETWP